jgi:hypothetical protein
MGDVSSPERISAVQVGRLGSWEGDVYNSEAGIRIYCSSKCNVSNSEKAALSFNIIFQLTDIFGWSY